jgi:hypothetical protein
MEITLNFLYVNWFAVLAAAIASCFLGGFWYSPFAFGNVWRKAHGSVGEDHESRNVTALMLVALLLQWIAASLFAAVLGPNTDPVYAINIGLLVGVCFVGTSMAVTNLFENRSIKLLLINGGYHVVSFGLMGLILGFLN